MKIEKALPSKMYYAALAHSQSPEFAALLDSTIEEVRGYFANPDWNRAIKPGAYFSYGKDSMAMLIVLKMAGVDFAAVTIDNQGNLPTHHLVVPEWEKFFGEYDQVMYATELRFVDYMKMYIDWGKIYKVHLYGTTKDERVPVDYWNWGAMESSIMWEAVYQFQVDYMGEEDNVLLLWANRSAEAMNRAFEITNHGRFYLFGEAEKEKFAPYYRSQPIGHWKNIDVWALLVREDAPVSEIYSYHEIPQKSGNGRFPRTLNYAAPEIMSSTFYKWLARYAPAQLQELCDFFPELPARFNKKLQRVDSKKQFR